MNYWDSVGRWINTLLVFIVGILAFDALFRMLRANDDNVIVGIVRVLALAFLVPFQGMFGEQDYVLTTLFAVLGYALLAGIALGVLRSLQASRTQQPPQVQQELPADTAASRAQAQPRPARRADREQRRVPAERADQRGTTTAPRPAAVDEPRGNGRTQARAADGDTRGSRPPRGRARDRAAGQRRPGRPDTERSG